MAMSGGAADTENSKFNVRSEAVACRPARLENINNHTTVNGVRMESYWDASKARPQLRVTRISYCGGLPGGYSTRAQASTSSRVTRPRLALSRPSAINRT
ncbi:MAG: hypothetical protein ACI9SE_003065 [Neolewinella sp.]|jgi:hypothetical protein